MRAAVINLLLFGLAVAGLAGLSVHVVDQRDQVLVLRQGHLVRVEKQPGVHWNLPLVDTEEAVDMRPAMLVVPPAAPLQTADHQQAVAGVWLAWRVTDAAAYWTSFGADETAASAWLTQAATAALNRLAAQETLATLETGGQAPALTAMRRQLDRQAAARGLAVIDLRLCRTGLPDTVVSAISQRMAAASTRQAAELRAAADDAARSINAETDRQVAAIKAAADTQARDTAAAAARQAAAIRAGAYAQSPAFYRYWRGLTVLRQGLQDGHGVVVLERNSPLLKFLPPPTGQ